MHQEILQILRAPISKEQAVFDLVHVIFVLEKDEEKAFQKFSFMFDRWDKEAVDLECPYTPLSQSEYDLDAGKVYLAKTGLHDYVQELKKEGLSEEETKRMIFESLYAFETFAEKAIALCQVLISPLIPLDFVEEFQELNEDEKDELVEFIYQMQAWYARFMIQDDDCFCDVAGAQVLNEIIQYTLEEQMEYGKRAEIFDRHISQLLLRYADRPHLFYAVSRYYRIFLETQFNTQFINHDEGCPRVESKYVDDVVECFGSNEEGNSHEIFPGFNHHLGSDDTKH